MFNFPQIKFPQMPQMGQGLGQPGSQMQPMGQGMQQMPNTQFPLSPGMGGPMQGQMQPPQMPQMGQPQMPGMAQPRMQQFAGMPGMQDAMNGFRAQMSDWRGLRPDHMKGGDNGDFRQQMADWRGQRPDRQSYMSGMLPSFNG